MKYLTRPFTEVLITTDPPPLKVPRIGIFPFEKEEKEEVPEVKVVVKDHTE